MSADLRQKLTRPSIWLRLVYMIVLAIAFNIAEIVIFAVTIFQFLSALFTKKPNARFAQFGRNLARYNQQIIAYLTFASEERPFPFAAWPNEVQETPMAATKTQPAKKDNAAEKPAAKSTSTENPTKTGATKPPAKSAESKPAAKATSRAAPRKRSPRSTAKPRKPKAAPKKDT